MCIRDRVLASLSRGESFGEQCLLPMSGAQVKRTKRRTSVVASGSAPLVVLVISPHSSRGTTLRELGGPSHQPKAEAWYAQLLSELSATCTPGIDAVSMKALNSAEGGAEIVHSLIKVESKKGRRERGRLEDAPAAAPVPSNPNLSLIHI